MIYNEKQFCRFNYKNFETLNMLHEIFVDVTFIRQNTILLNIEHNAV